jgi:hypothetical protein
VLTEPAVPTTRNGCRPGAPVGLDGAAQRGHVHPLPRVGRNPADRVGAEAEEIRGLLDPRVRLGRSVEHERMAAQPLAAHVPAGGGGPRGEHAHEVGHVAAAHEQPARGLREADQLGHPPHRLALDLGRQRRQAPCAHVLVDGRREEVAEHADRCRARRDVAEEARVPVEERVIEELPGSLDDERAGGFALDGQRALAAEQRAHLGGRLAPCQRRVRHGREPFGHQVHELVADLAKLTGRHRQRRGARPQRVQSCGPIAHRSPSKRSVSRVRPPFTQLNTR